MCMHEHTVILPGGVLLNSTQGFPLPTELVATTENM